MIMKVDQTKHCRSLLTPIKLNIVGRYWTWLSDSLWLIIEPGQVKHCRSLLNLILCIITERDQVKLCGSLLNVIKLNIVDYFWTLLLKHCGSLYPNYKTSAPRNIHCSGRLHLIKHRSWISLNIFFSFSQKYLWKAVLLNFFFGHS